MITITYVNKGVFGRRRQFTLTYMFIDRHSDIRVTIDTNLSITLTTGGDKSMNLIHATKITLFFMINSCPEGN